MARQGHIALKPLSWDGHSLVLLDQTQLPSKIRFLRLTDYPAVVRAIQRLAVRGAPLIGVAGAFALVLEVRRLAGMNQKRMSDRTLKQLFRAAETISNARPTAVNLSRALMRMSLKLHQTYNAHPSGRQLVATLEQEARNILREEEQRSYRMGHFGANLIADGFRIMTICNAGKLAAPGLGTALAPIYLARRRKKKVTVYVPETRPLLQGARLTALELSRAGIKCVVLADAMLATVMPKIDLILVGADRIAVNGDTANKIGTYQMALLARRFQVPFYVVAPITSFDFSARDGDDIPIEQRGAQELMFFNGRRIAPEKVAFHNPAFDITPAELLTGIITEKGILAPPYHRSIARLNNYLAAPA